MTTTQDAPPSEQTTPPEHPVVAHLRSCLEKADRHRLDLATKGGHARLAAQRQLEEAQRYDDQAMAAHAQVDTWQTLLDKAQEEVVAEQRKIDAIRAAAAARPPVPATEPPTTLTAGRHPCTPTRRCNGCARGLRPATPGEAAALAAGQPLPDIRQDCPDCSPTTTVEQS